MIAMVLRHAGLDPTFLIGGDINEVGSNAHSGEGEWLVAEADESDASFLWLAPEIAVVTNIEEDHLDHYRDLDEIKETSLAFLQKVPSSGALVLCADDPGIASILPRLPGRIVAYGLQAGQWRGTVRSAGPAGIRFTVERSGSPR